MITIVLKPKNVKEKAAQIIEAGGGEINDLEILDEILFNYEGDIKIEADRNGKTINLNKEDAKLIRSEWGWDLR